MLQAVQGGRVDSKAKFSLKNLREPADLTQGRPQVVGDGVSKGFQLFVGSSEFSIRTRQFRLLASQRLLGLFACGDVVHEGVEGIDSPQSKRGDG